ncbi:MAG: indole-3-glycerol-phosphate synthase [Planctomycetes bacterium]|nr:indole-3-glycerol-phosphate synthase [Planctomycetota bacterium]
MPDFLEEMAAHSRARASDAKRRVPLHALRAKAEQSPGTRQPAFASGELAVIAEIKRHSPARGELNAHVDVAQRAQEYAAAGVAAISVLTEPSRFHGSLVDLSVARAAVQRPLLRKDFLVDPYQLYEARAHGADGVLLIARLLDDPLLRELLALCDDLSLFALVEAFDAADVQRAQAANAHIIGINCRNLADLSIDFKRFAALRAGIDASRIAVAESGITTPAQFAQVAALGYHAALIGSALMQGRNGQAALHALRSGVTP